MKRRNVFTAVTLVAFMVIIAAMGLKWRGGFNDTATPQPVSASSAKSVHEAPLPTSTLAPTPAAKATIDPEENEFTWPDRSTQALTEATKLPPAEISQIYGVLDGFERAYFSANPKQPLQDFFLSMGAYVTPEVMRSVESERTANVDKIHATTRHYAAVACRNDVVFPMFDAAVVIATIKVTQSDEPVSGSVSSKTCSVPSLRSYKLAHILELSKTSQGWKVSSLPEFQGG